MEKRRARKKKVLRNEYVWRKVSSSLPPWGDFSMKVPRLGVQMYIRTLNGQEVWVLDCNSLQRLQWLKHALGMLQVSSFLSSNARQNLSNYLWSGLTWSRLLRYLIQILGLLLSFSRPWPFVWSWWIHSGYLISWEDKCHLVSSGYTKS